MKTTMVLAALALTTPAMAQYSPYGTGSNPSAHMVSPYETNRGTYVAPHMQTNPNTTQYDNYNTRGNVNPYNGHVGTQTPRW